MADRARFRIADGDSPAPAAVLRRVARLGDALLQENGLGGRFDVESDGLLALVLPESDRTFFHNGIVFAALDAYNDPIKNPTLTLSADDLEP